MDQVDHVDPDFSTSGGMGTNAFFTFTICLGRGLPYEAAFAAVFVAGCIFILLSITGLRTLMIRLFPEGVKESILHRQKDHFESEGEISSGRYGVRVVLVAHRQVLQ